MENKNFTKFLNEICDKSIAKIATCKDKLKLIRILKKDDYEDRHILLNGYDFFINYFSSLKDISDFNTANTKIIENVLHSMYIYIMGDNGNYLYTENRIGFIQYSFTTNSVSRCIKKVGKKDIYSVNNSIFNICTIILLGSYNQILKYNDPDMEYIVFEKFMELKPLQQEEIFIKINQYLKENNNE